MSGITCLGTVNYLTFKLYFVRRCKTTEYLAFQKKLRQWD